MDCSHFSLQFRKHINTIQIEQVTAALRQYHVDPLLGKDREISSYTVAGAT
jgi:hypothetical protein